MIGKCAYCNHREEAINFTQLGLKMQAHKIAKHPEIVEKQNNMARRLSNSFLRRLKLCH